MHLHPRRGQRLGRAPVGVHPVLEGHHAPAQVRPAAREQPRRAAVVPAPIPAVLPRARVPIGPHVAAAPAVLHEHDGPARQRVQPLAERELGPEGGGAAATHPGRHRSDGEVVGRLQAAVAGEPHAGLLLVERGVLLARAHRRDAREPDAAGLAREQVEVDRPAARGGQALRQRPRRRCARHAAEPAHAVAHRVVQAAVPAHVDAPGHLRVASLHRCPAHALIVILARVARPVHALGGGGRGAAEARSRERATRPVDLLGARGPPVVRAREGLLRHWRSAPALGARCAPPHRSLGLATFVTTFVFARRGRRAPCVAPRRAAPCRLARSSRRARRAP